LGITRSLRRLSVLTVAVVALTAGPVSRAAQNVEGVAIPKVAKNAIDGRFKGWKLAIVDPQATSCLADGQKSGPPFVQGDLDGDGRPDVALAIKTSQGVRLVAVLARLDDAQVYDIDGLGADASSVSLALARRGMGFTNPNTTLPDWFATDALITSRCGQARTAYVWSGSKFDKLALPAS
jgi:hypothetical protein